MSREVRILLVGVGNLGRRFCRILVEKSDLVEKRYGLKLILVGIADSKGIATSAEGLDPGLVAEIKEQGGSVTEYPGAGREGSPLVLIRDIGADLLCESTPVNLHRGGEPGLTHVREALLKGMHVVTPNKGPIVLAYRELMELAREKGVELRFDGTVAGGLPALYLGEGTSGGLRSRR